MKKSFLRFLAKKYCSKKSLYAVAKDLKWDRQRLYRHLDSGSHLKPTQYRAVANAFGISEVQIWKDASDYYRGL